ncbi:MAG: hypothetical protein KKB02_08105, partial [Alphaproteobacteria bacterium]|nr:hypothetical protein [Alphaproteobacteria bacterium]
MTHALPAYDSHLAGAFGPTLLIDLGSDRILAASPEAAQLFQDPALAGSRLSPRIATDFTQMIVFID